MASGNHRVENFVIPSPTLFLCLLMLQLFPASKMSSKTQSDSWPGFKWGQRERKKNWRRHTLAKALGNRNVLYNHFPSYSSSLTESNIFAYLIEKIMSQTMLQMHYNTLERIQLDKTPSIYRLYFGWWPDLRIHHFT